MPINAFLLLDHMVQFMTLNPHQKHQCAMLRGLYFQNVFKHCASVDNKKLLCKLLIRISSNSRTVLSQKCLQRALVIEIELQITWYIYALTIPSIMLNYIYWHYYVFSKVVSSSKYYFQVKMCMNIPGGIKIWVEKFNGFYSGEITIISRII